MADEYARSIAKVAAGQLADLAGYEQTHLNALEAVGDVLLRYIREIGLYAKESAESQGRTDVSAPDVALQCSGFDSRDDWFHSIKQVEAVDEMGHSCADLLDYLKREPRDPFAHALPQFPIIHASARPPSFKAAGIVPPRHIPDHLPVFPDQRTLKFTALHRKRKANKMADHVELSQRRRQAEAALIQLQQKRLEPSSTHERKPNPFTNAHLAAEKEPLSLDRPAAVPERAVVNVRGIFEPIMAQEAPAAAPAAQAHDDVDGDIEMIGEDEDGYPAEEVLIDERETWRAAKPAVDDTDLGVLFKSGRVAFSVDVASKPERLALRTRNATSVEDAFERSDKADGGARRRTSMFDSEKLKKKRSQSLLQSGADAINMDDRQDDEDMFT